MKYSENLSQLRLKTQKELKTISLVKKIIYIFLVCFCGYYLYCMKSEFPKDKNKEVCKFSEVKLVFLGGSENDTISFKKIKDIYEDKIFLKKNNAIIPLSAVKWYSVKNNTKYEYIHNQKQETEYKIGMLVMGLFLSYIVIELLFSAWVYYTLNGGFTCRLK